MADFRTSFNTDPNSKFKSSFSTGKGTFVSEGTGSGTRDHTKLHNRGAANQHPVSAIEGLAAALASRPDTAITNYEIFEIVSGGG
jgi:hypothetical protein